MRTRFIADLNPAYPSKGQRRWAIFRCDTDGVSIAARGLSFQARKSAEKLACTLMVEAAFAELGIVVEKEKRAAS